MSQSLATYNRSYSTRSCRQQCFYGNGITTTENVLAAAAVITDGHEVAQDFTLNHEDISTSYNYKQQIIGHTIQSVEDIEKWLKCTSETILNPEPNVKIISPAVMQTGLNEQLSEVTDKELLTDIEFTAKKLNVDYDAILTELQSNKIVPVNEKDNELVLQDVRLHDLIVSPEISVMNLQSDNDFYETQENVSNVVEEIVEFSQVQNKIESMKENKELKNKTEVINKVNVDLLDSALTMSIQDLSIETDYSDGSSDPSTNSENESNSQNVKAPIAMQKISSNYNTRSKSNNLPKVRSRFEPDLVQRKRKVCNEKQTEKNEKSKTVLHEKPLKENCKASINKSPRLSTSESSGCESDDLFKGKNPAFVTNQELIIAKALQKVGITEDCLEFFYNEDNMKMWRCHLTNCGREFVKLCYLKFHLMAHMNVKPFKCDYSGCSGAFYTEFKLKRHKQTHLNKKDFVCSVPGCQRRFTTIYNLASHEKLHTRPNKIACQVSDCTAKFQTKRDLDNHMKCHDESLAPYACKYENCSKRFYSKNALMTHQRCHNYSEEDLKCSWPGCGKTFDYPSQRKSHMRFHTGQKPYACNYEGCDLEFSTSCDLKRHQKKHTNDRKFVCDEEGCDKAFMRAEHLKEHKITHSEKRMSFKCYHCSADFPAKSSLYFHIKNHADEDYVYKLRKKRSNGKKTNNRIKKNSVGSSGSESTSTEETENISVPSNCTEMPVVNVHLRKMLKCPIESCTKWYSHRSSLRVHLRKHTSPLTEIQNGNEVNLGESTDSSQENSKSNKGAARTGITREYVLNLKPEREVIDSNEVGAVELSDGFLPSVYCQEDVNLPAYQILLLDNCSADGIQAFD